jgi:micrococcal nuclease
MAKIIDAKVLRVIDGDTVEVQIDKMTVRLDFIDAPETRGIEKQDGLVTKQWLKEQIEGKTIQLDIKSQDMYHRFLSVVYRDGINLNGEMVKLNLAEIYSPSNHNNGEKN